MADSTSPSPDSPPGETRRPTADWVVAGVLVVVLLAGLAWSWQIWQASRTATSGMMDGMMSTSMMDTGPSPFLPFLVTLVLVVVVTGGYRLLREHLLTSPGAAAPSRPTEPPRTSDNVATGDDAPTEAADSATTAPARGERDLLDVLPEDERRVLRPVIESPGLTQIELRDRADFSKSKISQTVGDLEKRGLVARERQGRTFRVYPGEDLPDEP